MNKDMHIPAGRTALESATISVVGSAEMTELLRCWACGSCRLKLDLVAILEVPKCCCSLFYRPLYLCFMFAPGWGRVRWVREADAPVTRWWRVDG
jgi:hypothetical protein